MGSSISDFMHLIEGYYILTILVLIFLASVIRLAQIRWVQIRNGEDFSWEDLLTIVKDHFLIGIGLIFIYALYTIVFICIELIKMFREFILDRAKGLLNAYSTSHTYRGKL